MRRKRNKTGVMCAATLVVALATFGLAGSAQAKLVGEFTKFQYCPWTNTEVKKCLYSVTEGGEVVLGKKTVPIEKKVVIQGGFGKPNSETTFSKFFAATNGETLQKVPQNVPGGLAGIVPEKGEPFLVQKLINFFFENKLTGLSATLELAKPASEIELSESNMARKEGVAMKLPVKVHLENPFLGSKCYIGSEKSPISWNLTSGATSPPAPNTSIEGSGGKIQFLEEGLILQLNENSLVDNAWSAPTASGCGGILAFLVNPIINAQLGTTTAGHNSARLNNTIQITTAAAVKFINEENP
jgi:hypothetical protein